MNFLELSDAYLKDAQSWCTYDMNIPFQYRVMAKLISDNNYDDARRIMEANADDFAGEYHYLILEFAVESCINEVIDENGIRYKFETGKSENKNHIYRPTPKTIEFIQFCWKMGQTHICQSILINWNTLMILWKTADNKQEFNLTVPN